MEQTPLDKRSFVMGMVTAFCECVAGGCKRLALSPPLTREEYERLSRRVSLAFWERLDGGDVAVRAATSWATEEADVDALIALLEEEKRR